MKAIVEKTRQNDRFADLKPRALNDAEKSSLLALAMKVLSVRHYRGRTIKSPEDTQAYLRLRLADKQAELFGCLYLDNRHRVLELRELFQGTIDGTSVYPRVVVQQALQVNAAAVILFHNHPSGVAEPSQADERITRRLKSALELIDVRVLDHFIVAAGDSVSMASRGLV
jgi:DNA repair protein RadC